MAGVSSCFNSALVSTGVVTAGVAGNAVSFGVSGLISATVGSGCGSVLTVSTLMVSVFASSATGSVFAGVMFTSAVFGSAATGVSAAGTPDGMVTGTVTGGAALKVFIWAAGEGAAV